MMALNEVLSRPDVWRGDRLVTAPIPAVPSGFAELDAELPGGGWPRGALTEILLDGVGVGEVSLLLPALARVRETGGWSLVVAPPHLVHGPAWAAAGVDLAKLVVVCPLAGQQQKAVSQDDIVWATEQALSSGAPEAVLCWGGSLDPRRVRRLQVAVAGGHALAFLFRPAGAALESSVAPLRLKLSAESDGSLAVQLLKRRGPPCSRTLHLDVARRLRHAHEPSMAGAGSPAAAARSSRRAVPA